MATLADARMEKDCVAEPVEVRLRAPERVALADVEGVFDDEMDAVVVLVAATVRVVVVDEDTVLVEVMERDCEAEDDSERVARDEAVTVPDLKTTVGVALPVNEPEGDADGVFDGARERVREGEPEGLREDRPDRDRVGVPDDVLLDETEPEDVLELVVVFETDAEPVTVLEILPEWDATGESEADFEPAEVRVPVLVDVAVLLEIELTVAAADGRACADATADFVDVFDGIDDIVAATAASTARRAGPARRAESGGGGGGAPPPGAATPPVAWQQTNSATAVKAARRNDDIIFMGKLESAGRAFTILGVRKCMTCWR